MLLNLFLPKKFHIYERCHRRGSTPISGIILSQLGLTPFDIRDHGLRGANDDEIYAFAQKNKAILLSADLGFSNILRFPLGKHYGIVILRFPNELPTIKINKMIYELLLKLSLPDYLGNLIILSPGKLRLKRFKSTI
jgi:predicted nuclease of predicted toxin-antitoxin system